jgi:hypothetical protein
MLGRCGVGHRPAPALAASSASSSRRRLDDEVITTRRGGRVIVVVAPAGSLADGLASAAVAPRVERAGPLDLPAVALGAAAGAGAGVGGAELAGWAAVSSRSTRPVDDVVAP